MSEQVREIKVRESSEMGKTAQDGDRVKRPGGQKRKTWGRYSHHQLASPRWTQRRTPHDELPPRMVCCGHKLEVVLAPGQIENSELWDRMSTSDEPHSGAIPATLRQNDHAAMLVGDVSCRSPCRVTAQQQPPSRRQQMMAQVV